MITYKIFNCEFCNNETKQKLTNYKNNKTHFCSKKCYINSLKQGTIIEFNCENCQKTTKQKTKNYKKQNHHFCSRDCRIEFVRKQSVSRVKKICPNCNNEFELYKCQEDSQIYCNKKCRKDFYKKEININDVIDMYVNQQLGTYTIKKKYNTNQHVIESILKENGIKLRDKSWVLKNRPPFKGHKYSNEEKENIRQKAIAAYEKDPTLKDRIRQKTLEQISSGKMPKANTSIEKIMANLLTEMKISFEFQKVFGYWCYDFYLPKYQLFIECDGDYWHAHPNKYGKEDLNKTQKNNIKRGKQKETYAKNKGYSLIRFWECDLSNNLNKIKNELCNKLNIS